MRHAVFFLVVAPVVLRMLVLRSGCLGDAIHRGEELLFGPRPWRCTVVRMDDSNKVSPEKLKKNAVMQGFCQQLDHIYLDT